MAHFLFNSYFTTIIGIVIVCAGVIAYCYHIGAIYDKFKKEGIRVEAKIISKEKNRCVRHREYKIPYDC